MTEFRVPDAGAHVGRGRAPVLRRVGEGRQLPDRPVDQRRHDEASCPIDRRLFIPEEWDVAGLGLATHLSATFNGAKDDGPTVSARYFDTASELGFLLEIAHLPAGFQMPAPEYVYPAARPKRSCKQN
jgi:hypothetical protein